MAVELFGDHLRQVAAIVKRGTTVELALAPEEEDPKAHKNQQYDRGRERCFPPCQDIEAGDTAHGEYGQQIFSHSASPFGTSKAHERGTSQEAPFLSPALTP